MGIDVYSTLNIQHLESLNDVVYQITGIRVTETVPDALLKRLKDSLVDLPVPELLERMNHGKIYLADVAPHALQGFLNQPISPLYETLQFKRLQDRWILIIGRNL
jgi:two-component system sensor histidine kinase KdpD